MLTGHLLAHRANPQGLVLLRRSRGLPKTRTKPLSTDLWKSEPNEAQTRKLLTPGRLMS
jgi:hypothetical protein